MALMQWWKLVLMSLFITEAQGKVTALIAMLRCSWENEGKVNLSSFGIRRTVGLVEVPQIPEVEAHFIIFRFTKIKILPNSRDSRRHSSGRSSQLQNTRSNIPIYWSSEKFRKYGSCEHISTIQRTKCNTES